MRASCAGRRQLEGASRDPHKLPLCPRAALSDEPPSSSLLTGCLFLIVCLFVELLSGRVENARLQVGARAAAGDADSGGAAGR